MSFGQRLDLALTKRHVDSGNEIVKNLVIVRMLEVEIRKIIQETDTIVAVNLIMKARLSAKLFFWKLVLFAYE